LTSRPGTKTTFTISLPASWLATGVLGFAEALEEGG
jgi:hypothetical protein